jgi:bacterioferritin-associated ferredoxin
MSSGPGVRVAFRLDDEMRVEAVGFETAAFDAARPVASRMCRALLGATLDQASALSIPDLAVIAGLPVGHPAVRTVHFAKSKALLPLLGRRAHTGPEITCTCFHVATDAIRAAIRDHRLTTVEQVRERTKAGCGCGSCRPDVQRLLDEERAR